jgi:hypothetical protein
VLRATSDGDGSGHSEGMRSFTREHAYDAPAEQVVRLWRDPEFLAAVGAKFGGVGTPRVEQEGDTVVVTTTRQLPMDKIPSFVRRFIQSGTLEQRDEWPAEPVPPVEGRWTVSGKMPAKMSGRQSVVSEGNGCRVTVVGEIDVSAPLVAGRLEELTAREITKLIGSQQEFAEQWLSGRTAA